MKTDASGPIAYPDPNADVLNIWERAVARLSHSLRVL